MTRRLHAAALAIAFSCCPIAYAAPLDFLTAPFQVSVNVDPSGHVSSLVPIAKLPDAYEKALETNVTKWKFVPPHKGDRAVATTTWLRVRFHIKLLKNGNSEVQVLYIGNGPHIEETHLAYPPEMHRWRIEAVFYMHAIVEPDGSIDHISLAHAFTSDGRPAFAAAQGVAEDIAAHWKAQAVTIDGTPVASQVILPVAFLLYDKDIMGRTTAYWRNDHMKPASDSPSLAVSLSSLPIASVALAGDSLSTKDVPNSDL